MAYTYDKQPACSMQPGTNSTFTLSASSQSTPAFGAQTRMVRVATAATFIYFTIGDGSPTATTNSPILGTNIIEYFMVNPGQKCAVLGGAASSFASVTEMS